MAVIWTGCGPRSLLRKANRLDEKADKLRAKAVEKGAKLTADTTFAQISLKSPEIKSEWQPQLPLAKIRKDTVIRLEKKIPNAKKKAEVRVWIQRDTITRIELYCPEQDVKGKAPVKVENKYEAPPRYNFWDGLVLGLIIGTLALFAIVILRQRKESRP